MLRYVCTLRRALRVPQSNPSKYQSLHFRKDFLILGPVNFSPPIWPVWRYYSSPPQEGSEPQQTSSETKQKKLSTYEKALEKIAQRTIPSDLPLPKPKPKKSTRVASSVPRETTPDSSLSSSQNVHSSEDKTLKIEYDKGKVWHWDDETDTSKGSTERNQIRSKKSIKKQNIDEEFDEEEFTENHNKRHSRQTKAKRDIVTDTDSNHRVAHNSNYEKQSHGAETKLRPEDDDDENETEDIETDADSRHLRRTLTQLKQKTEKVTEGQSKQSKDPTKLNRWSQPPDAYAQQLVELKELSFLKNATSPTTASSSSFHDLGIPFPLLENLKKNFNITTPTPIQVLAIPEILKRQNVICAAQTGTGKTLAFLLPIVSFLQEEMKRVDWKRRGQQARAIILVPTRELVNQTMEVCIKLLCDEQINYERIEVNSQSPTKSTETEPNNRTQRKSTKVWKRDYNQIYKNAKKLKEYENIVVFAMGIGRKALRREAVGITNGVDILIATPDRFLVHYNAGHLMLDETRVLVIDEADTLYTLPVQRRFLRDILSQFSQVEHKRASSQKPRPHLQYIFVSATLSESFVTFLRSNKFVKNLAGAVTESLHKSVPTLQQNFIFGGSGDFKRRLLFATLKKHSGKRTIIFCNSVESCKGVNTILAKKGYNVALLHSELPSKNRSQNFEDFNRGKKRILVTTDIASRGLDIEIPVEHVILYDFPLNSIDYLHRVGRTARAGI
jgi:superfamily II DNA/RNA helicase